MCVFVMQMQIGGQRGADVDEEEVEWRHQDRFWKKTEIIWYSRSIKTVWPELTERPSAVTCKVQLLKKIKYF